MVREGCGEGEGVGEGHREVVGEGHRRVRVRTVKLGLDMEYRS
jgi:hypothetical protein